MAVILTRDRVSLGTLSAELIVFKPEASSEVIPYTLGSRILGQVISAHRETTLEPDGGAATQTTAVVSLVDSTVKTVAVNVTNTTDLTVTLLVIGE